MAVRLYLRYALSYRDVEELLAEQGIEVDHVTVYRWVRRFTPLPIDAARPCRHAPGDRWFVDETYVKITGGWVCLHELPLCRYTGRNPISSLALSVPRLYALTHGLLTTVVDQDVVGTLANLTGIDVVLMPQPPAWTL